MTQAAVSLYFTIIFKDLANNYKKKERQLPASWTTAPHFPMFIFKDLANKHKEVWHRGRVSESKPEEHGSSLSPELLLLKLSSSVKEVRHL